MWPLQALIKNIRRQELLSVHRQERAIRFRLCHKMLEQEYFIKPSHERR